MKGIDLFQLFLYLVLLIALAVPLGRYMARVYQGERTWFDKLAGPVERLIYRLTGVDAGREMNWWQYALAVLVFNISGMVLLFLLQLVQGILPLNPQHFGAVKWDLSLNTAISFMTNTNWQAYSGESTMSYLTQMAGLTVQNFLSAATGMAVVIALIRGLARHTARTIGNFWVDLTRSVLFILLPISVVGALFLVSQGVIQNLSPYLNVHTLEGARQTLAMGPVASQEFIKELGTNGGGFFNANSAHPFENPTPLTNLVEMLAILVIPAGLAITFGRMVKDVRQGRVVLAAMLILFVLALGVCYTSEVTGNPQISALGVSGPTAMEGKEVRFGITNSALFATVTTAASCGAVNTMHDSLTPLGGLVPMLQIMLGEVVFGGVGSGLYGMLIFVILTVFIVGLMVGRTPEYLGKKIESREMKMATLAVLIPAATILIGAALAAATKAGTSSIANPGPHGLSEILYAFASGTGNNGSAFAGLNANTLFYNLAIGLAMFIGRFGVILPVLAIAGSMAAKKAVPAGPGTFETTGGLFAGLLSATVLIVGALTFFPALALGPIVEQLLMFAGKAF
ncbi:potassium-transporting ATPase subunit KdpA [Desulfotomaculum copahuensis]|uniref:Potassium-transporting ATPase potassium-binding subunit n=1 Tax=Desulfotomaculum copahuensis TaxID=1838280 RepID=A0A1B7LFA5_9FIRM|nr:potassium-transporting ATPase subunit KdpA [Desulfotomaculum copahuensis]OAT82335.1 potassium-transporting ATPase subunit KdpA [Desulfotomaculum copahuensis]